MPRLFAGHRFRLVNNTHNNTDIPHTTVCKHTKFATYTDAT